MPGQEKGKFGPRREQAQTQMMPAIAAQAVAAKITPRSYSTYLSRLVVVVDVEAMPTRMINPSSKGRLARTSVQASGPRSRCNQIDRPGSSFMFAQRAEVTRFEGVKSAVQQ
nr:hypothetical protein CFP56_24647 [Quercus suber]